MIAQLAQVARWQRLLARCGLPEPALAETSRSPVYGALSSALRDAEARGLDVEQTLPLLVAGRSLEDAADLAAALHGRVTRFTDASRAPRRLPGGFIAGILAVAHGVEGADLARALEERAAAIECRADALVARALEHGERWLSPLGADPQDTKARARWIAAARALAAYRDRWSITGDAPLGAFAPASKEQARHLARVADAIGSARTALRRAGPESVPGELAVDVGYIGGGVEP